MAGTFKFEVKARGRAFQSQDVGFGEMGTSRCSAVRCWELPRVAGDAIAERMGAFSVESESRDMQFCERVFR